LRALAARLSKWVTRLEEACLAGGILGIAALTIANVVGRVLFDHSLAFAEELSQFLIVFVTFLGIGYAAAKGRHIRMTAVYDQLGKRSRKRLAIVIAATTSALLFYLTYLGLDYTLGTMHELGSVSPVLEVPLWTVYLSAPLGFGLGGIQYALAVVRNLESDEVYLSYETRDDEPAPADGI